MRVLLVHQNFPGQFKHVATAWRRRPKWEVIGIGRETAPGLEDLPMRRYRLHREPHPHQHPYLRRFEPAVLHGQAVARVLLELKRSGFAPDVMLAHPGWGETLYARDVFPSTRLVHFCEWFYRARGADMNFDPEFPIAFDDEARIRTWNALHLLNLENCDRGVTPTRWQWQQHPDAYRPKIEIAHEGIDTEHIRPASTAALQLPNGITLKAGDPVVTYVARNLEPYRGFHVFVRALEVIQRRHASCHALVIGGDDVSYGKRPTAGTWREVLMKQVQLDPARVHFLGKVPYPVYLKALQVSAAHVYLTVPFVLSWSLLEAMASGALVVASKTPPVEEVIEHGKNGLLAEFFDAASIADLALRALQQPLDMISMRAAARAHVERRYALAHGLAAYDALIA